jgi:acetyl esterase/lipase
MNRIFYTLSLSLLYIVLTAQIPPTIIPLWPDVAPNNNGLTGEETQLENGRVGNVSHPTITVYYPDEPNGMAIIMCPGGGYFRLAINHEGHDMAKWFNELDITYIVLKYRMPNGHHEVPLSDAEQAIRIIRLHAEEWGVNPHKVGIMGASAGGHLASTLATHYSADTRPDFHILLYPAISMLSNTRSDLLGENPSEELKRIYSNELQVNANTPSAFITFSTDDPLASNGILYYSALLKNHIPTALHAYPSGGHGWGFKDDFIYKRQWTEELEKWLKTLKF